MSESYVATGDGLPTTRSLAAVLRDAFSGPDDATRLIVGTLVSAFPDMPDRALYVTVAIMGQNLKVPFFFNSRAYAYPVGTPLYMLATRTQLFVIGALGAES